MPEPIDLRTALQVQLDSVTSSLESVCDMYEDRVQEDAGFLNKIYSSIMICLEAHKLGKDEEAWETIELIMATVKNVELSMALALTTFQEGRSKD